MFAPRIRRREGHLESLQSFAVTATLLEAVRYRTGKRGNFRYHLILLKFIFLHSDNSSNDYLLESGLAKVKRLEKRPLFRLIFIIRMIIIGIIFN